MTTAERSERSPTSFNPVGFILEQATKSMQATVNLSKHVLGIDRAKTAQSPRHEVLRRGKTTLWHYRSANVGYRQPVLLVPSLVSRAFIFDLQPGNSFVEQLLAEGLDVYLIDWGEPDEADAGNTLETYTHELLPIAVAELDRRHDGAGVTVFGYCFGGVLTALYAATHADDPIANLAQLATPIDFSHMPKAMMATGQRGVDPRDLIDETGNVPAAAVRRSFSLLTPTAELTQVADFWEKLHDEKFIQNYQAMTSWSRDHVPFPGATFLQTVEMIQDDNGLANGTVVLDGEKVDFGAIAVPFVNILGDKDHIVPAAATEPLLEMVGSKDKTELRLPAGHVGMIVGSRARNHHMPAMTGWIVDRSEPLDA